MQPTGSSESARRVKEAQALADEASQEVSEATIAVRNAAASAVDYLAKANLSAPGLATLRRELRAWDQQHLEIVPTGRTDADSELTRAAHDLLRHLERSDVGARVSGELRQAILRHFTACGRANSTAYAAELADEASAAADKSAE